MRKKKSVQKTSSSSDHALFFPTSCGALLFVWLASLVSVLCALIKVRPDKLGCVLVVERASGGSEEERDDERERRLDEARGRVPPPTHPTPQTRVKTLCPSKPRPRPPCSFSFPLVCESEQHTSNHGVRSGHRGASTMWLLCAAAACVVPPCCVITQTSDSSSLLPSSSIHPLPSAVGAVLRPQGAHLIGLGERQQGGAY